MKRPDAIYVGGVVLTVDAANRVAEAVAVRNGRIEAVASSEQIRDLAGPSTRVVELDGRTLIPGFVDGHSHLAAVGDQARFTVNLGSPPLGSVRSMADVVTALRERAAELPPDEPVLATGYDDSLLAECRHPTRRDLDRVSSERPVVALHVSGHLASANSRALELAGIARDTPQPEGGVIRRDDVGEPDGVLEEPAAMMPLLRLLPRRSPKERLEAIEWAAREYARRGVTTAQNGATEAGQVRDLQAAVSGGRVPIRLVVWPSQAAWERMPPEAFEVEPRLRARLRIGAIKLFADGSIQGYTGHLCHPYRVPLRGKPEYRGYATLTRDQLGAQVARSHRAGFQVAIHANGDAAIDDALEAFDRAQREAPRADARHVVVHAQMAREDQLDRMLQLGVIPSFFVLHTYYWGDRHRDIFIGPERARRISPTRSAVDRGLRFTIHTDAPVVPMDPLMLMWAAVNRRTSGGEVLGPEQRLTPIEALRAATIDPAWQAFEERTRGSIEPGKLADLAILSANPLANPESLRDIEVLETIVGGETVYP